jgi:hypothetical protein
VQAKKKTPAVRRDAPPKDRTSLALSRRTNLQQKLYDLMTGTEIHLDSDPDAAGPEGDFFHHFRSITIVDLTRVANPKDFWFRRVLPMCHDDPVVRQVVVALGAAHRCYLDKLSSPDPGNANAPLTHFESIAVTLYNEAIRKLITHDAETSSSGDSELTFLICCLLFVCLDCMLGRFDEAVRHMQAGCRLLEASDPSTAPKDIRQLYQETGTVFLRFTVDATTPLQEYDIPDMMPHAKPLLEMDDGTQPFLNLADAREAVWDLAVRLTHISPGPDEYLKEHLPGLEVPDCGSNPEAWAELVASFGIWRSKFSLLVSSLGSFSAIPFHIQREVLVLIAQRYMWDIILYAEDSPENEELQRLCNSYIDVIEQAYRIEASWMARPVFTLDSDTIPAMFHTATFFKNPVLTQRVIALLRRYKRREGLWDSWKVADMLSMKSDTAHPTIGGGSVTETDSVFNFPLENGYSPGARTLQHQ